MEEKYGFVYLWFDKKHKKYYIGSHWGFENDGYVCSSSWMMQAYKRRPNDFKRKILSKIITCRQDLLNEELRWFSYIKDEEVGKKYYNLNIKATGHWTAHEGKRLSVGEKISKALKGKPNSSSTKFKKGERRNKQTEFKKGQDAHNKGKTLEEQFGDKSIEIRKNLSKSHKGKPNKSKTKFKSGQVPWNKGLSKFYITDGINTKVVYDDVNFIMPNDWYKGRTFNKIKGIE